MKILKKRFREEEREIMKAREEEMQEMDRVWAEIAKTYEEKCNHMIQQWERKKENDVDRLREVLGYLQDGTGKGFSKDLVNLKKTEVRLAKQ